MKKSGKELNNEGNSEKEYRPQAHTTAITVYTVKFRDLGEH